MGITEDQWVVEEGKSRKNIVSHFTPQKSHIHLKKSFKSFTMMTVFISKYFSHYQSKSLTVSYVLLKLTASSAYKNDKWHFDQSSN